MINQLLHFFLQGLEVLLTIGQEVGIHIEPQRLL